MSSKKLRRALRDALWWAFGPLKRWRPLYWLRCHTYNRYHVVDCRNRFYKWGWSDVDYLMLYSAFALLQRFVEKEDGLKSLECQGEAFRNEAKKWLDRMDKESMEIHVECLEEAERRDRTYDEVRYLWHWWTKERFETNIDDDHERDTEMLVRLVKVRGSLWT